MLARLEEVAVYDDEGRIDGMQFDSRERRIQEWREKKEEREFAKLVQRLQSRNSQRRRMKNPQVRERSRESQRRYVESGKKWARDRERRIEKYKADPVICTCEQCGSTWCVVYEKKSKKASRFCDLRCRQRHKSVARWQREKRNMRTMDARQQIIDYVTANPGCVSGEVANEQGLRLTATRTLMSRMVKEGVLRSDGGKPAKYYLET